MDPVKTTVFVLVVLWLLGVTSLALSGFAHVLAAVAVAFVLFVLVTNRRVNH